MMRSALAAVSIVWLAATPATAQDIHQIDIPAGRLDRALATLSRQTGASIGAVDITLRQVRSPRIRGRYTVKQALERLLASSRLDFVVIDARTFRIVRASPTQPPRSAKPSASQPPRPTPPIIVRATKQGQLVNDYPGTAILFDIDEQGAAAQSIGLGKLVGQLPTTAQTNLGSGRNKIFLRGIADSSFSGTTQSTVALYLGETRLAYSGPNPDLRLYDQDSVEILEGPQGTLYGAGAIGGIIRITPKRPNLDNVDAAFWGGGATTRHGGQSYDLAALLNVPVTNHAGLRTLVYRQLEGGYIDDVGRGLADVNRTTINGLRSTLLVEPGDDWQVELGVVHQTIEARDGQYSESDQPSLERRSALGQPFETELTALSLTVNKDWGDLALTSATGYVFRDNFSRFDATNLSPNGTPTAFDERLNTDFINHETRLSWHGPDLESAVIGLSLLQNDDRVEQRLGPLGSPASIGRATNSTTEIAVFGEGRVSVLAGLDATLGGRLVYTRSLAETVIANNVEIDPSHIDTRVLGTAGLTWKPDDKGAIYIRFQQGFRAGGLSIALSNNDQITRFRPDTINTYEVGVRWWDWPVQGLSATISGFHSEWDSIQADLIDMQGFPRTANIGNGRVYGVAVSTRWQPSKHLSVQGRFFANESELTEAAPGFVAGSESRLPNIAELGATFGAVVGFDLSDVFAVTLRSDLRYVGTSQLGLEPFLQLEQGNYVTLALGAELLTKNWTVFANASNVLDSGANAFAFGNPFTAFRGNQISPVRPRTLRLGLRKDF